MTGWTAPVTQTAGHVVTSTEWNNVQNNLLALNGYAIKTADESVTSNAALQDDDHLFFTVGAVGTYVIDLFLLPIAGNAAGDIKIGFTFPTGTCHFFGEGLITGVASGTTGSIETVSRLSATSGSTANSYGLSATQSGIWMHAIFVATATGTFKMQWAQRVSSATATTLKAGSHMAYRQVA